MKTKDILGIYWNSAIGEVDGQTFYLFSRDVGYIPPNFPLSLWPENTETKSHKLFDDDWVIWLWDVKFSTFPNEWKNITRDTLSFFINNGAMVTWCGLDGCFSEPPELFDPQEMSEGVYAAMDKEKVFYCHTDLDEEYKNIEEYELIKLKDLVIVSLTNK